MPTGQQQGASPPDHNEAAAQRAIIQTETAKVIALEKQRKSINDDIAAAKSTIKALNVDMDAWKASKRRQAMDPDVRAEFDRSQALCNEALGVPIQADLFGNDDDAGNLPTVN
jgi:predicted  nucleic acid-binding Zn-ribbon protein